MPRIPIQQQQAQVQPNKSFQPIEQAFGGNIAQAKMGTAQAIGEIGKVASLVENHLLKMEDDNQKQSALDLSISYKQDVHKLVNDPEKGLSNTLGTNAFGVTAKAQAELKKLRDKYESQAKTLNPKYQQWFGNQVSSDEISTTDTLSKHEAGQRSQAITKSTQSLAEINLVNLSTNRTSKNLEETSNKNAELVESLQKTQGFDDATKERMIIEYNTKAFDIVAQTYIDDQPEIAQELLTKWKGNIDPAKFAMYEDQLNKSKESKTVNTIADKITSKYKYDLGLALSELDKEKLSPELKDKATNIINSNININQTVQREADNKLQDITLMQVNEGIKSKTSASKLYQIINKLPQPRMTREVMALTNMVEQAYKPKEAKEPRLDLNGFLALNAYEKRPDWNQDKFVKTFAPLMTPHEAYTYIHTNFDENGKYQKDNPASKAVQMFNMTQDDILNKLGIDPKSDKYYEQKGNLGKFLNPLVEAEQKRLGRKLNFVEMADIVAKAGAKVSVTTVREHWFDKKENIPAFESGIDSKKLINTVVKNGKIYGYDAKGNLKEVIK